jgi:hypothetical protein
MIIYESPITGNPYNYGKVAVTGRFPTKKD